MKFKRGDLPDVLLFLVVTFILATGIFILAFVIPAIGEGLGQAGLNESVEGARAVEFISEFGTITLQRGFFFLMVGLMIGTMVSSFFTAVSRLALVLYIFFLIITIFLGAYLGNAFEQVATNPVFADTLGSQGLITIVMQNIVMITLITGVISIIITFSQFLRANTGGAKFG